MQINKFQCERPFSLSDSSDNIKKHKMLIRGNVTWSEGREADSSDCLPHADDSRYIKMQWYYSTAQ